MYILIFVIRNYLTVSSGIARGLHRHFLLTCKSIRSVCKHKRNIECTCMHTIKMRQFTKSTTINIGLSWLWCKPKLNKDAL